MKIKTIDITALDWFDKVNGNSYFAGTISVNYGMKNAKVLKMPFQYGYGDQYRWTALEEMAKAGWLPKKYSNPKTPHDVGERGPMDFERENNYPIEWMVSDGLKRDCVRNGRA